MAIAHDLTAVGYFGSRQASNRTSLDLRSSPNSDSPLNYLLASDYFPSGVA